MMKRLERRFHLYKKKTYEREREINQKNSLIFVCFTKGNEKTVVLVQYFHGSYFVLVNMFRFILIFLLSSFYFLLFDEDRRNNKTLDKNVSLIRRERDRERMDLFWVVLNGR